jgi:hypothetical protein
MTAQTDEAQAATVEFGRARLRKEDERLITGQTNCTSPSSAARMRTRGSRRWT